MCFCSCSYHFCPPLVSELDPLKKAGEWDTPFCYWNDEIALLFFSKFSSFEALKPRTFLKYLFLCEDFVGKVDRHITVVCIF